MSFFSLNQNKSSSDRSSQEKKSSDTITFLFYRDRASREKKSSDSLSTAFFSSAVTEHHKRRTVIVLVLLFSSIETEHHKRRNTEMTCLEPFMSSQTDQGEVKLSVFFHYKKRY